MKLIVNGFARAALCTGALASALLLAACGGGTQLNNFVANRVIALGDESSVINNDGSKYTVNALLAGSTTALDCVKNPIWIQSLAAIYGLVFPQCIGSGTSVVSVVPTSRIYATNGATVADLSTQIDTYLNNGGVSAGDLVTVLVGANDVIQQFNQYPAVGEDQLTATLEASGTALANQVNRLAGMGVKVLISTIPNMGLTPFAGDRSAGSTNSNPALLGRLSTHFNDALLATLTNDGHHIGLIQLDEYLQAVDSATLVGQGGSFSNSTQAACAASAPLPTCTTNTLVASAVTTLSDGSVTTSWLWADNLHLAPTGQLSLGSLAISRAQNNPF